MRKVLFASVLILVLALSFYGALAGAQEPEVVWRGGQPFAYCPHCGKPMGPRGAWFGMGPGMMGPWMMGPEMMPWAWGPRMMHHGYAPYGPGQAPLIKPLEEKDVKAMLENYIQATRNPNLKLGKIKDKDAYFEAEILTKNNALVDTIIVDKQTGWMRSMY